MVAVCDLVGKLRQDGPWDVSVVLARIPRKADRSLPRSRNGPKGTNRLIDRSELALGTEVQRDQGPLQTLELLCEIAVRCHEISKRNEGSDYIDAHLHRSLTIENRGGHNGSMLGECERRLSAPSPT